MTPGIAWLGSAVLALQVESASTLPRSLAEARDTELAMLREERSALQHALEDARARTASVRQELQTDIDALARSLAELQADNVSSQQSLPAREALHSTEAQQRHLEELLDRASTWLEARGVKVPDGDPPILLAQVFDLALGTIEASASLHLEEAQYFTRDGLPHRAEVLRVGGVGTLLWQAPFSPLIQTPEGLIEADFVEPLHVEREDASELRVVLQDPRAPIEANAYRPRTWLETFHAGGPLMWVLLAFAIAALGVAFERTVAIAWIAARWRAAVQRLLAIAATADPERTLRLGHEQGWIARPLVVVIGASDAARADVEERATHAMLEVREGLFRRLSVLGLMAAVAPLAGLLGTVNGMITTFSVVTERGTSDPQGLAGGIAEALLTTQFGLAIAIPALIAHALLTRGARRVLSSAEQTVLGLMHDPPDTLAASMEDAR